MNENFKLHPALIKALLLIFMLFALWLPRGLALDRFATIDEPRWLMRSANFYLALSKGDYEFTFQREHPGVTITWAGTAGFLRRYPSYIEDTLKQRSNPVKLQKFLLRHQHTPLELLEAGRSFVVFAIVATLALAFLYAIKLIGPLPAFIGFLLIAFDPFSVALSRLLHLDGLLSALMLLSLLSFMSYLYRGRRILDLLISATAAGLGWLTKSPALFLLPFFGLLVLIELIQTYKNNHHLRVNDLWYAVKPLLIWLGIASLIFVFLWPAMWVNPLESIQRIISQATTYAAEGNLNPTFFNGQLFDSGESAWYFYPITYLWRTSPPVLIGFGLAILGLIFWHRLTPPREWRRALIILGLFSILYTLLMTLSLKKSDRYLLPVYAPLILVSTLGWFTLLHAAQKGFASSFSYTMLRFGVIVILSAIILVQLLGVLQTFPYYFNYYNPLMGGSKKAGRVMMIGWGEGLDQAGRYLNSIPGANKLRVISWYGGGALSYFFRGTTIGMESDATIEDLNQADFVVLYFHQWQRQIPSSEVLDYFDQLTPEHTIWIGDFEYAKIYNMHEAPALAPP